MGTLLRSALTAAMIIGTLLLGVGLAGPAAAIRSCVDECPTLSVNTASTDGGTALTVSGDDFGGRDRVSLALHGAANPIGSAQTDAAGAFRMTLTLPASMAGRRPIIASDPITAQQVRQVLTISTPNAAAVGRGATATDRERSARDAPVALIGLGALAVVLLTGGGLLLMTRRNERIGV